MYRHRKTDTLGREPYQKVGGRRKEICTKLNEGVSWGGLGRMMKVKGERAEGKRGRGEEGRGGGGKRNDESSGGLFKCGQRKERMVVTEGRLE